jgi:surface antigen
MALVWIGTGVGACTFSRGDNGLAKYGDITGSIGTVTQAKLATPTESDLAFARNAASDVLTRGEKDASQPWENPETGARGSVTPLAQAYSSEGRTCRDFLASYVNGTSESWLQGAACQTGRGRWEIHTLKPWRQS